MLHHKFPTKSPISNFQMSPAACTARAGHTVAQNRLCEMCAGTVPRARVAAKLFIEEEHYDDTSIRADLNTI